MNINQLRYFVSVYESRSFSQAAQKRDVTVQAVSKSISDLEREFPESLFVRSNQGAIPTPLGREFYQRVIPVLGAFNKLESFAQCNEEEGSPSVYKVALCAPNFFNDNRLCKGLSMFISSNTGLSIELFFTSPEDAQRKLEAGVYDALITVGGYSNPKTNCMVVGTLPTGIAVTNSHPLASKSQVTLSDLRAYPAVESPVYDAFNDSILNLYKSKGLITNTETLDPQSDEDAQLALVRKGYFFTAVFPVANRSSNRMKLVPINSAESIKVPVCSVTLKSNTNSNWHIAEEFFVRAIGSAFGNELLSA